MKILAIDTSCDETAAAVTVNTKIVSNIVWTQSSLHARFGGVLPSLAQRQHEARIDWVVNKALATAHCPLSTVDCIAVTIGPGLGIALGVGINYARELAIKYKLPLIPINHVESHLLSAFAIPKSSIINHKSISFPALGLVLSGGTTLLCLVKNIGDYEILAETSDDALGEALDKAARLLGLGYPGGAILEKFARSAHSTGSGQAKFKLPIPLINDVIKNRFSYSGLKTALVRLFSTIKNPTKQDIYDLAACFQEVAFKHVLRVLEFHCTQKAASLLLGGGVANNILLKSKLRKLCKKHNIKLHVPYTKKLNGDNAGMIGVCANLKIKYQKLELKDFYDYESVDRKPRLNL